MTGTWGSWQRQLREPGAPHPNTVPHVSGVRVTENGAHVFYKSWAAWRYAKRYADEVTVILKDVEYRQHKTVNENGVHRHIGGGL